ncbi:MAG TPA: arylsulfatase [Bryobacteraceae bacterium]|nr:arylsulfatase [Bryobacteraceae bacterium]
MNRRSFVKSCLAGAVPLLTAQPTAQRPNVVLIYADDIGYGDLGCYGASRVKTPNLDRIARNGIRFTHAHSTSATCTPSRYSLMTGEYAWRRPGTAVLPGDARLIIKPGTPTLPSILQQAEYRTGVVGKWHLGLGTGTLDWNGEITPGPNQIGFNYSFLVPATGDRVPCVYVENGRVTGLDPKDPIRVDYQKPIPGEPTGRENPELLKMHPSHGHDMAVVNGISRIGHMTGGKSARWVDEDMADVLTRKAQDFIRQGGNDRPFFLYFATHDIHVPRVPHKRFAGQTGMGPRGDVIAQLDWCVGQILDTLDKLRLTDNTIVMFSSDNGPVVDDGYKDQAVEKLGDHKPAGAWRGGKYSNFEAGTRVPFLLQWPKQVKAGVSSDALISQVDLLRSCAKLADVAVPSGGGPDSQDILNALLGRSMDGREHLVEHASSLSLIQAHWKYIEPSNRPAFNKNTGTETGALPEPQLYNLRQDPGERKNLAAEDPERVRSMAALLDSIRKRTP